jgi:SulP family sulfate permease
MPSLPEISFSSLLYVIRPAFTIAVLGAIESLLSCVVADVKSGDRHDSNKELVGQGIANVLVSAFGGIPATGAIARTATNVRSGGNSPVAGVVHAIVILVIMLAFAPWAGMVPLACLAPVLMVVAWNMSEVHQVRRILKGTRGDIIVLVSTFFLTVFADLTLAVEFGLLMAAVLFIKRMADVHRIEKGLPDANDPRQKVRAVDQKSHDCLQLTILTIEGALFFGAATKFEREILSHIPRIRMLIIRMGNVPMIDATGERALMTIAESCQKHKVQLMITGLQAQPSGVLAATGLLQRLGEENIFTRTGPAIDRAITQMDRTICGTCPYEAFRECAELKGKGEREKAEVI